MTPDPTPPPTAALPPPDRGSATGALAAWAAIVLLLGAVVVLNQVVGKPKTPGAAQAAAAVNPSDIVPGDATPFGVSARGVLKLGHVLKMMSGPSDRSALLGNIDDVAQTPLDEFRAAIAAGELAGADAAKKRLDEIKDLDAAGLASDAALLRRVLDEGSPSLSADERDALVKRHGWFGRLALVLDKPDEDPDRAQVLSGGGLLLTLGVSVFVLFGVSIIIGFVVGILTLVRVGDRGLPRAFVPVAPGGSAFLESVPVFIGAFLLLSAVMPPVAQAIGGPKHALTIKLLGQWLLLPIIFWPLLRGTPWREFLDRLGWTKGQGVFREIGAGIYGYFAGLPVLFVAFLVTVGIVLVGQAVSHGGTGKGAPPPENPVIELAAGASPVQLILFVVLATCWAPIVEEAIFRGAFFHHLRTRVGMMLAAVVSALAFGMMHGYAWMMLLPVITIGLVLAVVREWRGSLIACITAHALHNGTLMTLMVIALSALKP